MVCCRGTVEVEVLQLRGLKPVWLAAWLIINKNNFSLWPPIILKKLLLDNVFHILS
jgi:hypothetical protein